MWQRLIDLLDRSGDLSILVVGDYMIDRYLYGDAERISPEAPVPVLRILREEEALGGAGSVVANIAALGALPHCVGVVGDSAEAEDLTSLLKEVGANTDGLLHVAGRRTTRKTRLVGLAQHRHRQQLIRIDDETIIPIDEQTVRELTDQIEAKLAHCQALCIEDYNKGVITPGLAKAAIEAAKRNGVPVLVDPASIPDYSRYAGAMLITPNRTEAEKLVGLPLRDLAAIKKAAANIQAACCAANICLTLDADGAALIGPDGRFEHIPTKRRDVYDVTGAGDEVLAALAVSIAAGSNLTEAVQLANIAGGLEVEKFGCVPITRREVQGEIHLEHHRILGKVRTVAQLLPEITRRRAKGETVAFTNGCFDIIHAGHTATFSFCHQHADILVVGLNSDASVRRQEKGTQRPIVGQADRAAVLEAMSDIDYVVIFDEAAPQKLIEAIGPDVLIKGNDWRDREIAGRQSVEAGGGKVLFAPFLEGHSSTRIIERIRSTESS